MSTIALLMDPTQPDKSLYDQVDASVYAVLAEMMLEDFHAEFPDATEDDLRKFLAEQKKVPFEHLVLAEWKHEKEVEKSLKVRVGRALLKIRPLLDKLVETRASFQHADILEILDEPTYAAFNTERRAGKNFLTAYLFAEIPDELSRKIIERKLKKYGNDYGAMCGWCVES